MVHQPEAQVEVVTVVGRHPRQAGDAADVIAGVVLAAGVGLQPVVEPARRPRHAAAGELARELDSDVSAGVEGQQDALLLREKHGEPDQLVGERDPIDDRSIERMNTRT